MLTNAGGIIHNKLKPVYMKRMLVTFDFPGMTSQKYDQVWEDLRNAGLTRPKGLIHHIGAPTPTGWIIVDVWESVDRFKDYNEILLPILSKYDIPLIAPRIMPVHYYYNAKKIN
jgi:hypothetical protein